MATLDKHVTRLEEEILALKTQLNQRKAEADEYRVKLEMLEKKCAEEFAVTNEELVAANEELEFANEKLINEKRRLESIGDNIPNGTLYQLVLNTKTGKLKHTYIGRNCEQLTGVPVEEALTDFDRTLKAVHPDDMPVAIEKTMESADALTNYFHETRFIVNGEVRCLQMSSCPRQNGHEIIWEGIAIDITQRKKMEIELKHEKERLETLGNNLPGATLFRLVHEIEPNKMYMEYVNANWESITGLAPELIYNDISELEKATHPDDRQFMKNEFYANVTFSIEIRFTKNGKTCWLNVSSHPHLYENKVIWDGIIRDVTARKEIESELAEYRKNLEYLVQERTNELSTINMELIAANEEIKSVNEELYQHQTQLEQMVEKRAGELRMSKDSLLSLSRRQNAIITVLQIMRKEEDLSKAINLSLAETGKYINASRVLILEKNADDNALHYVYEWTNAEIESVINKVQIIPRSLIEQIWNDMLQNGKILCISDVHTLPTPSSDYFDSIDLKSFVAAPLTINGVHYGIMSFDECAYNRDWEKDDINLIKSLAQIISSAMQRYNAEKNLIVAKEKAEEADKLKTSFLANLSHEIRTPLNAIISFSNFIGSEELSHEEKKFYMETINSNSAQLLKMIDNIVDVSKLESGQIALNTSAVNINNLLVGIKTFYDGRLNEIKRQHTIGFILDNSCFIEPCIVNVDEKHLRQVINNLLDNAIKFTDNGSIIFGYRLTDAGMLEFSVHDSGIGMTPNQKEIIFERFRQVDLMSTRLYGGIGVGLSISHGLVKLMGGNMWVESTEGAGSSFYFTIPMK